MKYRPLGRLGPKVSILGFGASPLGGMFGPVEKGGAIRAVRLALDLGVNFFDVSPYYGNAKAESVLGEALRGVDRESYVLSTKVGRYGERDFDFSADRVRRSLEESAARLGTPRFDVVFCHDVEFADPDQLIEETIPALLATKESGTVGLVGISGYPLRPLERLSDRSHPEVVLSYAHLNLHDDSFLAFARRARAAGTGVVNAAPLSMGLLTPGGPPPWHPASAGLRKACVEAATRCETRGVDVATLALQYALAFEETDTTLVGISNVSELERNVAAMESGPDPETLAEVLSILARFRGHEWPSGNRV